MTKEKLREINKKLKATSNVKPKVKPQVKPVSKPAIRPQVKPQVKPQLKPKRTYYEPLFTSIKYTDTFYTNLELIEMIAKAIINFTIMSFGRKYNDHPFYKALNYLYESKKYKEEFLLAKYVSGKTFDAFTIDKFQNLFEKIVLSGVGEGSNTKRFTEIISDFDKEYLWGNLC